MPPRVIVNYSQLTRAIGKMGGTNEAVAHTAALLADDASAVQAVLSRALVSLKDSETLPDVLSSPDDQAGALLQVFLAEQAEQHGRLEPMPIANTLEAKFDDHDFVEWFRHAGWGYLKARMDFGNKAPFPDLPSPAGWTSIADTTRIAILGDWGTGLYGAPRCAVSIAGDRAGFGAVIHLGDVYYAGAQQEVKQQFLNLWPRVPGALSRACNSNHEMYAGGEPYFCDTLPQFGQSSSVFVLQNNWWVIVGLDTAYDDGRLHGDQVATLQGVIDALGGRKLIVLSHHPLFSQLSKQGRQLQESLRFQLDQVFAWYWGHEHLCAIYETSGQWGLHGRCIGHSGYPYFRPEEIEGHTRRPGPGGQDMVEFAATKAAPGALILDGPNPYVDGHAERYGPHGYMVLDLADGQLHETLFDCDGVELWHNDLS